MHRQDTGNSGNLANKCGALGSCIRMGVNKFFVVGGACIATPNL